MGKTGKPVVVHTAEGVRDIDGRREKSFLFYLKKDWRLYVLLSLPFILVVTFKYASYPGLRIAFLNYMPARGYEGSEFIGLENFGKIFKDADFIRALRNTLIFNFADLMMGFPAPIILALLLNEIRFRYFKKISQTVLYLPHFLSWVIVASIFYQLLKPDTGIVNVLLAKLGFIKFGIPFLTEKYHWAVSYILIAVWQGMGWGSIIYLAAITNIPNELYEAATVNGAGRWAKIRYIILPSIKGTAVTLLIINLGRIMGSSFERLHSFDNVQVREFQYQLAIYIYEKGLGASNFSSATAVGLFQSLTGLLLVLTADRLAKWLGEDGLM